MDALACGLAIREQVCWILTPARFLLTEIYNRCSVDKSTMVLFRTVLFTVECNFKCRATELRTKWTGR